MPLLERLKFCAIFTSNLDEFFQVRVAALKDQVAAGLTQLSPDGRSPGQQLIEIGDRVEVLVRQQEDLFVDVLIPAIAAHGIVLCRWSDLDLDDRKHLDEVFDERVFPVLTPLGVDPAHPFPYISNLSLNLAVLVYDAQHDQERFARVKVPPTLPRFIGLPDGERFILLEDLIAVHLDSLFPGMTVVDHWMFRVTRNADLTVEEEEADDLLAALEMELRRRRFGRAVRLEIEAGASEKVLALLVDELDLTEDDISFHRAPLDLTGLWALHRLDRPELKDELWPPVTQARLAEAIEEERSVFEVIRGQDVLVHHPYDSFTSSVEELIRQAADDPDVLSIKVTLYRTSGDSAIAQRPDPGRRAGRAGGGAGGAQGPLRRAAQHHLGQALRGGRRPRRPRRRGAEDPLQVHAHRAGRARGAAPVRPHRDRQLQLLDRPALRGSGAPDLRSSDRLGPQPALQQPDRLLPRGSVPAPGRGAALAPPALRSI